MSERPTWTTQDGTTLYISDMETSHIKNCIAYIDRIWPELPEEADYLTADGDGLTGVLYVPGRDVLGPKRRQLKKELAKRHNFSDKEPF